MKVTKQTTYNWEAGINVSEQKTREFANYLLGLIDNKPVKQPLPFEIAPKATTSKGTWYHAKRYVEKLTIDGKTDWRLPTKEELNEIYQSENDFTDDYYWTSTIGRLGDVWTQHMVSGYQTDCVIEYSRGYVRAVRSDMTVNRSSTTSRFETGPKKSEIQCRWSEAQQYIENLTIDGKSGWRLPNMEELNEIYLSDNDFEKAWYWTSTTDGCGYVYSQHMRDGIQGCFGGELYKEYYVRVVRDLKAD